MGSVLLLLALFLPLAQAGDANCRNSEKCFTLGMTDRTVNPDLQHTIGSWPFPKVAHVKTYVGAQLHFEWDARYEFYSTGAKEWVKKDAGLRTVWETADGAPDPCTQTPSRPWVAKGQAGNYDETVPACAKGKTYRVRLISDTIRPKAPEALLEITVLPGSPPERVPTSVNEPEAEIKVPAKPADSGKPADSAKPVEPAKPVENKAGESKPVEGNTQPPAQPEAPETKSLLKALDELL